MERVDHPSKVEMVPGEPWTKRLKYTDISELIAEYEATNQRIGRAYCPVLDHFRENQAKSLEDLEAYVYGHPGWGPTALAETMFRTLAFNHEASGEHGVFVAAWVQHFCALELLKHKPEDVRHPVSEMLKHEDMRFVSRDALYCILALVCRVHPNPKRFLTKPEVRAKLPVWLDLTRFACPDFPELQPVPVTGADTSL